MLICFRLAPRNLNFTQEEAWHHVQFMIPDVRMVMKTTTMDTYEGEFRVDDSNALKFLSNFGKVTVIGE